MLTSRAIEAKAVAAIRDAMKTLPASHAVVGNWQPTAYGALKAFENRPSIVALVEVATDPPNQPTYSAPEATLSMSVRLAVRAQLDPQGETFAAAADALDGLFRDWMRLTYQTTFTALDADGFSVDGLSVSGSAPSLDTDEQIASAAWTLDLSGAFAHADDTAATSTETETETTEE